MTTTDREFLLAERERIDQQLKNPPCGEYSFDMAIRLPEQPWQDTPQGWFASWYWPLPVFDDQEPVWTGNEFDEEHPGSDLGYLNWQGLPRDLPEVYGGKFPPGNKYYVPTGKVIVRAPGPGRIWFSGNTNYGWTVRLDHGSYVGFPLNTYLTHMSKLFVPTHEGKDGPYIYAGQALGVCGEGGTDRNHVHFEMWDFSMGSQWGRPGTPIDPKLYLPHFGRVVQEI